MYESSLAFEKHLHSGSLIMYLSVLSWAILSRIGPDKKLLKELTIRALN